ncbi:MAG: hypothetical protein LKJ45_01215 [Oscillospiraceae bacterium]|jgi:hypothetical protein|nr:hypothetical protein [Oscillospiraceae bacterium]
MKKLSQYLMLIGIGFPILFTGCSHLSVPANKSGNLDTILTSLRKNAEVQDYVCSHNSKEIAVIYSKDEQESFSIISTQTGKETILKDKDLNGSLNLYSPEWSYDDAYLSVSEGCCVMHSTYVIDASTQKKFGVFKNTGMVWAANQDRIIYATVDESVTPVVETELSGSGELMCYNAATKQKTTIIAPNPKYEYNPISFDGTGNRLIYDRTDLQNDDKYELTLNIPLHNQTSSSS